MSLKLLALCLISMLLLIPGTALGIRIPEKFVYDLHWGLIKAGTAIQEVREEGKGLLVTSRALSASWLSGIYPVDDRVESRLSRGEGTSIGKSLNFRLITSEGGRKKDREVTFDQQKLVAHYVDHLKKDRLEIKLVPNTFDVYASFYYLRTLPLTVGKPVYLDVVDSRKLWKVEVRVLRKERLKTKHGVVNTIVVNPMVQSEGVFNRTGAIHIWLTDDDRRIPVQMQTKVKIGSITATLVGGYY